MYVAKDGRGVLGVSGVEMDGWNTKQKTLREWASRGLM
jgi:hypothetical protein